jgi:PAS domain S-box-containing protein
MNSEPTSVEPASVLIVDDHRENLRLLAEVLTQQGYTVRVAPSGRIALSSVQAKIPDLILLDVMMPEMDGYAVCTQLKSEERSRDIPVIFISAAGEMLDKMRAFAVGGVDYITKPFHMEEVLARVKTHLALRAAQKQLEEKNAQLGRVNDELTRVNAELTREIAERTRAEEGQRRALAVQEEALVEALRATHALRESEEMYRALVMASPDGITASDLEGRIIEISRRTLELHDYEDAKELLGTNAFDLIAPENRPSAMVDFQIALKEGFIRDVEYTLLKRDGTRFIGELSAALIKDVYGKPKALVATSRDITERKRAEEALKQSEETLRLIFENAFDGISIYEELPGRTRWLLDCNERYTEMSGRSKAELLEIQHTGQIQKNLGPVRSDEENLKIRREKISYTGLFSWIRPDGKENIIEYSAAPVQIGDRALTVGVDRDITDRVHTEEMLRRRNRELALLNQAGQELTATLDLQRVAERLLLATTETIGAEGASVWLWDDEQKDHLVCWAVTHQGQKHPPVNLRLHSGQGIVGWVAQIGESIVVNDVSADSRFFRGIDEQTGFDTRSILAVSLRVRDTILGVLEVVNKLDGDFSDDDLALLEALATPAAIAIDNARLVETLRQRTIELEARNEELDAFAHTVAHDLKNPLAQVVGFADLLRDEHTTLPDAEIDEWLGTVVKNGRRMSAIIDELLLLSSVRKVEEIEVHSLDMASVVAEAQDRLTPMIEEYQAEVALPDVWPEAMGYGPWIEEVWVNYLSNALKYGGRPPWVELGATRLPVPASGGGENGGQIRFWIRDNGPGISPEDQDRLFTLFTRLDQVRVKGHGLGLSIVRRIVTKLGGEVGVESELGQGSTFWFTLLTKNKP